MFSKMSSDRFGGKAAPAVPGPGSYDLPPTLDDHGVIIRSSSERFLDVPADPPEDAFRVHEDLAEVANARLPTPRTPRTPRRTLQPQGKENGPAANGSRGEAEGLQKRYSMVDANKGDLAIAKKAAANAQAMLRSRDAQVEELRKQVEELSATSREWQRRATDPDWERRQKSQSAQHHEGIIAGLQRSLDQSKSQVEAQRAQIEELRRAGGREGDAEEKRLEETSRELEEMARRLAAREAAVKAAVAESDARLRGRMASMESRVAAGWEQVSTGMLGLQEQHDRLQSALGRGLSEAKRREHGARRRERALRAEGCRLAGRRVLQQAYVGAALALWEREGQARGQAEERAALAQGSADREAAELARVRDAAEAEARGLRGEAEQLRAAGRAAQLEAAAAAAERDALRERLEEAAARGAEADRWQQRAEAAEAKSRACAVLVKERETLKRDVDALRAENDSLRATEKALQAEVERGMEQRAQLASHTNHRQKILMSQNIKDENVALHAELKRARQQIFQLERRLEHLREAPDATTESTPLL